MEASLIVSLFGAKIFKNNFTYRQILTNFSLDSVTASALVPPANPAILLLLRLVSSPWFSAARHQTRLTPNRNPFMLIKRSKAELLALMPRREREMFFLSLSPQEADELAWDWDFWGRPAQHEPPGDWSVWLAMAGRGFGKTRLGAEWVRSQVCGRTPMAAGNARRIALVGETAADVRDVMVMGPSGILATSPPDFRPRYFKSERRLEWPNGAVALTFSAEEPDQLRGPEHDLAWSDELAKWRYAQETWDMLQFGLRLGDNPRQLVTTTPRPIDLVREILKGEKTGETVVTRGSTFDNSGNLAAKFLANVRRKYEGTRLGRQELEAEILDDVPGALWTRAMLERRTHNRYPNGARMAPDEVLPVMRRIVVGVDPSGSSGENKTKSQKGNRRDESEGDEIGIIVAGVDNYDNGYILEDMTVSGSPAEWGQRVVDAYVKWDADLVVGESNYGGAMVEFTVRSFSRSIPFKMVHASRGKAVRAEPVAALYEQGRIRHYGAFPRLEDQMCSMTKNGYIGSAEIGKSPDRLDAAVWAVTELILSGIIKSGGQTGVVGLAG